MTHKRRAAGFTYPYPRPMVTVDAVVLCRHGRRLLVLAVERRKAPFAGSFALPGGFVEMDEDLPAAAARELEEETGLSGIPLVQLGAFGRPGRDPRGRNICIAFFGIIDGPPPVVRGGDDARRAVWLPARRPGPLAFDHNEILRAALGRLEPRKTRKAAAFVLRSPS